MTTIEGAGASPQSTDWGEARSTTTLSGSRGNAAPGWDRFNAFVSVDPRFETALPESALPLAQRATGATGAAGTSRTGRLVAVKDNIATAGMRTTSGGLLDAEHVPSTDAFVVANLREAGHTIVGKTTMDELAWGGLGRNEHYGDTINPAAPDRMTGGSSAGSAAAVAAGYVWAAVGTDTGGSVRIPASCTGIVALRPSPGTVSLTGVTSLAPSFDSVGPMARSVADCAAFLRDLRGMPPATEADTPPTGVGGVAGLRIGVMGLADSLDPVVRATVEDVIARLERAGANIREFAPAWATTFLDPFLTMHLREPAIIHRRSRELYPERYSRQVLDIFAMGDAVSAADYAQAAAERQRLIAVADRIFDEVDVVLTPTLPIQPARTDADSVELDGRERPLFEIMPTYTGIASMLGWPALSLPAPRETGVPIGVQALAARGTDEQLLSRAAQIEAVLGGGGS